MVERLKKKLTKHDSSEVQGEGSWVMIKSPSFENLVGKDVPTDASDPASLKFAMELLKYMVVDWNWVDDNGVPFNNPQDDDGEIIVTDLTFDEQLYLSKLLDLPTVDDQKN